VLDLGLVVIAWTVAGGASYLGLFDINCWYQAQMPGSNPKGAASFNLSVE
jgi:hypothetical protein